MNIRVRACQPADLPALSRICLATALHGEDGTSAFTDPRLPGLVYAEPYARLEPGLAWVAEDADGVCGYVLGAADTLAFARRCEAGWWPPLRCQYPAPPADDPSADAALRRQLHDRTPPTFDFLPRFPAHLHINLLPRSQRTGAGTQLIATFLAALRVQGVPGVHLGVSARNPGAQAFYARQGFATLQAPAWGKWMGRALAAAEEAAGLGPST
jgi:ribosomal protein S18 acetylase RimI-like enzyme